MSASREHLILAGLSASITFAVFYPFAALGLDFPHDGIMLKPAIDVYTGQVLFRDTFTQYGALTTWLHAVCLSIDPRLLSMRVFTVAVYACSIFLLVLSWLRFSPWPVAAIGVVLFLVSAPFYDERWLLLPWSSAIALLFQSAAAYSLCMMISNRASNLWPSLVGLSTALAFWARPLMVGVSLTLAIAAIWILWSTSRSARFGPSLRQWAVLFGVFSAVNVAFLAVLILQGALQGFLEQNVLWAFRGYASGKHWGTTPVERFLFELQPLQGLKVLALVLGLCLAFWTAQLSAQSGKKTRVAFLLPGMAVLAAFGYAWKESGILLFPEGWSGQPGGLVFFWVVLLAAGSVVLLLRSFPREDTENTTSRILVSYAVISLASLSQFYPTFSLPQQWWSLAPSFGLLCYFLWQAFGKSQTATILGCAVIMLPATAQKVRLAMENLAQSRVELHTPEVFSGIKVSRPMASVVDQVAVAVGEYSRAAGPKPIAVIGDDPLYGVFAEDKTNPTAYYVDWPGLIPPEVNAQRSEVIRRTRPVVVFASSYKAIDRAAAESFSAANGYEEIVGIAYRPIEWWIGGQPERLGNADGSRDDLSALILVPR